MSNKFIVLEGIDGVGKTTLAEALTVAIRQNGQPCIWFDKDPPRGLLTSEQKKWAHTEAPVEASFMLFLASAIYKSGLVTRQLEQSWVVMDRYVDSVFAHHLAIGLDESFQLLRESLPIREPDHIFRVTIPEDVRLDRVSRRKDSTPEDYESAGDCTTVLGRKRLWLSRLVADEIQSTDSVDCTVARMLASV